MRPSRLTLFGVGLLALVLAVAGCGKSGGGGSSFPTTPGGRTVFMNTSSSTNTVSPGGSIFVGVQVIGADDNPEAGVEVTLTTTLGRLDQATGVTNTNGTFGTLLRTSTSDRGIATVRAQVEGTVVTQIDITVQ